MSAWFLDSELSTCFKHVITHSPIYSPSSTSTWVIKVSGQMSSDAFKRSLVFDFKIIIFALDNFLLLLKSLINKEFEYLNLKF